MKMTWKIIKGVVKWYLILDLVAYTVVSAGEYFRAMKENGYNILDAWDTVFERTKSNFRYFFSK